MVRFSVGGLGLSQFRICQDLTGQYFVQELVEKGGFWSFTGHTRQEWISLGTDYCDVLFYDTLESAAADIESILSDELRKQCQKEKYYDIVAICLHLELDENPAAELLRKRLDYERINN